MPSMSYCRFRNTTVEMKACLENVDEYLDADESAARRKLAKLCAQFLEQVAPVIAEEDAQDSTYAEAEEEDEADYENRRLENRVFAAQLNEEES